LLGTLPLLAVGSGATASNSVPLRNGLIAFQGGDGLYVVDPRTDTARLVPKSEYLTDPAWSPDGTTLAVTAWEAQGASVYTMNPDGSERTLVLRHASSPSWSPDGKELVLVRETCGSDTSCSADDRSETSLAIVNADGTDVRELSTDRNDASPPVAAPEWSPDGKLIAFIDDAGSIGLITPDGERVPMPAAPIVSVSVSWSPDSSKLAYDRYEQKNRIVAAVFDRATGQQTILPGAQSGVEAPVWSPEGDQLVFNSLDTVGPKTTASCGEHFAAQVWVMAPDGTKAHRLGKGYPVYGPVSWARAVDAVRDPAVPSTGTKPTPQPAPTPNTAPTPAPTPNAAPPPTAPTPTDAAPTPNDVPKPKPTTGTVPKPAPSDKPIGDAQGLIAVRGKGGIYLVDPSSGKTREIPGTNRMWAPAWSPTMKELAVEKAEKDGSSTVYTIAPDGTHARLVLQNASTPSWSAAGDRIFAIRNECTGPCDAEDDAANVLYAVGAVGSDAQRVDFEDADAYRSRDLAWPTDGNSIHFFDEQSLDGPGTFDSASAAWSPDQLQLAFTGALGPTEDENANNGLWVVSAEGGKPSLLLRGASGRPSWAS
jgi:Tol biopolymer transport system component